MEKKKILIFTGAGVSAESGVATFRTGDDGLWYNHKVEDVATKTPKGQLTAAQKEERKLKRQALLQQAEGAFEEINKIIWAANRYHIYWDKDKWEESLQLPF